MATRVPSISAERRWHLGRQLRRWHLGADYQDSTSNNNDGTNSGTTNDPTGQIGAGDDFNGTRQIHLHHQ